MRQWKIKISASKGYAWNSNAKKNSKVKKEVRNTVFRSEMPHVTVEICVFSREEVTHICCASRKAATIIPYAEQDLSSSTTNIKERPKHWKWCSAFNGETVKCLPFDLQPSTFTEYSLNSHTSKTLSRHPEHVILKGVHVWGIAGGWVAPPSTVLCEAMSGSSPNANKFMHVSKMAPSALWSPESQVWGSLSCPNQFYTPGETGWFSELFIWMIYCDFFKQCVCMCVCVWLCAHPCRYLPKPNEGIEASRARDIEGCETPGMGAGYWNPTLQKSSTWS